MQAPSAPRPAAPGPATGEGAPSAPPSPSPARVVAPPPKTDTEARTGRARALIARWVQAQNLRDFEAYAAVYAQRFVGIKRSGPRTRRFESRKAWLADRRSMFRRALHVEVSGEAFHTNDRGVAVRFRQHFRSGSYQDVGRKQMVLLEQADGSLKIAKEEMLGSTLLGERAEHDPAQLAFVTRVRGQPAVAIESPARKYRLGQPTERADGEIRDFFAPIAADEKDPQLARWRGRSLRLFGPGGTSCIATTAVAHLLLDYEEPDWFSTWEEYWLEDDGSPVKLSDQDMREALWDEGVLVFTLDLPDDSRCGAEALFARDASLPPVTLLEQLATDAAVEGKALAVARSASSYVEQARYARAEYDSELTPGVTLFGRAGGPATIAWVVARDFCPCWSCDIALNVIVRLDPGEGEPQVHAQHDWNNGEGLVTLLEVPGAELAMVVFDDLGKTCVEGLKTPLCSPELYGPPTGRDDRGLHRALDE
ncbi:MAG: nuclear transport factor 2 family protein [Myxococcales bacterium]|nr:nuclear transport factor 2 family protein [Myxococcales bacterium]